MLIRVSQGTAAVIGLKTVRMAAAPTTASLMVGEHCSQNCGFCAQARSSQGKDGFLSRVPWPEFTAQEAVPAIAQAYIEGNLQRACLQVVAKKEAVEQAKEFLRLLAAQSKIPLSISCKVTSLSEIEEILALGVDRIGLALDAAGSAIYREVKGGNLEERVNFLLQAAEKFPQHISTHLIVGLGETEEEMTKLMQKCYQKGVRVGLFAFTPLKGTKLADRKPPVLDHYRRMQVARFLLEQDWKLGNNFIFVNGKLTDFGMTSSELKKKLGVGDAFRTSGCPDCNRPFYNERPGTVLYNYPTPLTEEQFAQAWQELKISF